jgi:hypothetical protein
MNSKYVRSCQKIYAKLFPPQPDLGDDQLRVRWNGERHMENIYYARRKFIIFLMNVNIQLIYMVCGCVF